MIAGISTLCFAASYVVALGLEVTRLFFRSGIRGALLVGFGVAGLVAHTLYLGHRAALTETSPLSSPHDWWMLAAWVLALLYLVTTLRRRRAAFGLFVLPLVLALVLAAQFASQEAFSPVRASRLWGNLHGMFLLFGTVAVLVGFVAGAMYLVHSSRLKRKMPPRQGFFLPSLEQLEWTASRALWASLALVAGGFLSGIVLHAVKPGHEAGRIDWTDPVVASLGAMLTWLLGAGAFYLVYPAARRGRKIAYLAMASLLFLALVLAVMVFGSGPHGGPA